MGGSVSVRLTAFVKEGNLRADRLAPRFFDGDASGLCLRGVNGWAAILWVTQL